jgi:hypothetical protein
MKHTFSQLGQSADGTPLYWGKKDSSDPTSEDLTFWFTLGKPRRDGENYIRISRTGFDEEKRFHRREDLDFSEALREVRDRWEKSVAAHLSTFLDSALLEFAALENATA